MTLIYILAGACYRGHSMTDTGLGYAPHPFYVKYVTFANLTAVYASFWSARTFVTSRRAQFHAFYPLLNLVLYKIHVPLLSPSSAVSLCCPPELNHNIRMPLRVYIYMRVAKADSIYLLRGNLLVNFR